MFGYTIISTYRNLETLFIYLFISILATENIQTQFFFFFFYFAFWRQIANFLKGLLRYDQLSIYAHVILTFLLKAIQELCGQLEIIIHGSCIQKMLMSLDSKKFGSRNNFSTRLLTPPSTPSLSLCLQGSSLTPTTPTKSTNTKPTKKQQKSLPTANTRKIHHHRPLHNSKPSLTQKSHTQVEKTWNPPRLNTETYSSNMKESKRSPDIERMNNTYTQQIGNRKKAPLKYHH